MKGAGLGAWRWVVLAMVGAAAIGLSGCASGAAASSPGATVPDTTVPGGDPFAVPAHITVPYVQSVLNALESVNARATAEIVQTQQITTTASGDLQAIFVPGLFADETNLWATEIAKGLTNYLPHPGPVRDTVLSVVSARSDCVYASISRDYSATTATTLPGHLTYVELVPSSRALRSSPVNPTPWSFAQLGYYSNGAAPPDPCAQR